MRIETIATYLDGTPRTARVVDDTGRELFCGFHGECELFLAAAAAPPPPPLDDDHEIVIRTGRESGIRWASARRVYQDGRVEAAPEIPALVLTGKRAPVGSDMAIRIYALHDVTEEQIRAAAELLRSLWEFEAVSRLGLERDQRMTLEVEVGNPLSGSVSVLLSVSRFADSHGDVDPGPLSFADILVVHATREALDVLADVASGMVECG